MVLLIYCALSHLCSFQSLAAFPKLRDFVFCLKDFLSLDPFFLIFFLSPFFPPDSFCYTFHSFPYPNPIFKLIILRINLVMKTSIYSFQLCCLQFKAFDDLAKVLTKNIVQNYNLKILSPLLNTKWKIKNNLWIARENIHIHVYTYTYPHIHYHPIYGNDSLYLTFQI